MKSPYPDNLAAALRRRLRQSDLLFSLALDGRIVGRDPFEVIFCSVKLERRMRHPAGKSREAYFSLRVRSGFQIEPVEPSKTVRDMHLDCRGIGRFSIGAHHFKFDGAGTSPAVYDGRLIALGLRMNLREHQREEDKDEDE